MKKLLLLLSILLLSGCSCNVDSWKLQKSISLCGSSDKISIIVLASVDSVTCTNGENFIIAKNYKASK